MLQVILAAGAVYTPALVIDPQEADQVTGRLAVNVWVLRACKLTDDGVMVRAEAPPVPVSETICGLLLALSVNWRVPVRVPAAAGLNTMLVIQFPAAASVVPQDVPEMEKSLASGPATTMPLMLTAEVVALASTTD